MIFPSTWASLAAFTACSVLVAASQQDQTCLVWSWVYYTWALFIPYKLKPGTPDPFQTDSNSSKWFSRKLEYTKKLQCLYLHSCMLSTFKIKDSRTMGSQRFMPPQVLVIPRGTEPARCDIQQLAATRLAVRFLDKASVASCHLKVLEIPSCTFPSVLEALEVFGQISWKGSNQKQALHNAFTNQIFWSVFRSPHLLCTPPVALCASNWHPV